MAPDRTSAPEHSRDVKMTAGELIRYAARRLLAAGVVDDEAEARIEAEVLLGFVLGIERPGLYAELGACPGKKPQERFEAMLARRVCGEPVAYITGVREFYGLPFAVDTRVLIPRPETELLVELALAAACGLSRPVIADVGCGSGCVAAAVAAHLPSAQVYGIDASGDALSVASRNVQQLGLGERVRLLQGDLLSPLPEPADFVLANLPYISAAEMEVLPVSVRRFEPRMALDGGVDGLALIRRLLPQFDGGLRRPGVAFLEVGFGQASEVRRVAESLLPGAILLSHRDLAGIERVVEVRFSE